MRVLFLIDGVAGAGKSDLITWIASKNKKMVYIEKYTTRKSRLREEATKTDLRFITDDEFESHKNSTRRFYTYEYGEKQYGFYKDTLDGMIADENIDCIFIIIRNQPLINELVKEYQSRISVVPVFVYSDRSLIKERLEKDKYSEETIAFRMKRSEMVFNDYLIYDIFDNVILNDSSREAFHQKINKLVEKCTSIDRDPNELYVTPNTHFDLSRQALQPYKDKMLQKLKEYPYDKNVFVMMKYRDSNVSTYNLIREELNRQGYNCVRADVPEWAITRGVINPIAVLYCCKFGIALFDEPEKEEKETYNPCAVYELGILKEQGKDFLLLKHNSIDNLPFDFGNYIFKPYERDSGLTNLIREWLKTL